MKWVLQEEEASPSKVYELLKRHRLLPRSVEMSASLCNGLATGDQYVLLDGEVVIGTVFVTGVEREEIAQLDFVPVARYFRTQFDDPLQEAVAPLLAGLFDNDGVRKIESSVPASRSRTKRALCSLGFKPEGRARDGVVLFGKEEPEDVRMLGLLRHELNEKKE